MRGAADRCQRIGACRKSGSGVMCPSYMATREEEHATRGRANALVKALSEPDPRAAMGDERLHEILDLCLECKACKSECPLGVDMASLKSEFLSHYQDIHGVPRRSRLFGAIRPLNRLGAATAPLSNLPARVPGARALLERTAGHRARAAAAALRARAPRALGPQRRAARGRRRRAATSSSSPTRSRPTPSRRSAARRSSCSRPPATACGWRAPAAAGARASPRGCSTRRARSAQAMVGRLAPEAERGVPIVGCEPSCLLTLREEHLQLLPHDPRAQAVAEQAKLVEELLVEAIDDGALTLDPASPVSGRPIVFHGHCHQKALAGTAATVALLQRIPGAEVTELDAGCCGMAGSFGFEAEHYELSMQIGESRLFPALRAAAAGALVAATGVSCRQQIGHGTGRQARHPVELVRAALAA